MVTSLSSGWALPCPFNLSLIYDQSIQPTSQGQLAGNPLFTILPIQSQRPCNINIIDSSSRRNCMSRTTVSTISIKSQILCKPRNIHDSHKKKKIIMTMFHPVSLSFYYSASSVPSKSPPSHPILPPLPSSPTSSFSISLSRLIQKRKGRSNTCALFVILVKVLCTGERSRN